MRYNKKLCLASSLLVAGAVLSGSVNADTLSFNLGTAFNGSAPANAGPWISAIFDDDTGNAHTVTLTLSAHNLSGSETVAGWYFNLDPALNPTQLSFSAINNDDSAPNSIYSVGDDHKADGTGGLFDIYFDFPPLPWRPCRQIYR